MGWVDGVGALAVGIGEDVEAIVILAKFGGGVGLKGEGRHLGETWAGI